MMLACGEVNVKFFLLVIRGNLRKLKMYIMIHDASYNCYDCYWEGEHP